MKTCSTVITHSYNIEQYNHHYSRIPYFGSRIPFPFAKQFPQKTQLRWDDMPMCHRRVSWIIQSWGW